MPPKSTLITTSQFSIAFPQELTISLRITNAMKILLIRPGSIAVMMANTTSKRIISALIKVQFKKDLMMINANMHM